MASLPPSVLTTFLSPQLRGGLGNLLNLLLEGFKDFAHMKLRILLLF